MPGLHSRNKGHRGEQEACQQLRDLWPEVRSKRAGGESAPQDRGRDLLGTPGACVQVKRRERVSLQGALIEANAAVQFHETTLVLHRQNRGFWMVTMPLADFKALWNRTHGRETV